MMSTDCPICGGKMKVLFSSWYCPKDCDKKPQVKQQYWDSWGTWRTHGRDYEVSIIRKGFNIPLMEQHLCENFHCSWWDNGISAESSLTEASTRPGHHHLGDYRPWDEDWVVICDKLRESDGKVLGYPLFVMKEKQ